MGWTVNFKSFDDVSCQILVDGGGGSFTGAANPIVFEEDDSDNLLDVLRSKTGYINLIETENGEFDDIYPSTNTESIVEVWHGSELLFFGYLQAQNFDHDWISAPRHISIPISSPLGVIHEMNINPINAAGNTTLGTVMKEVCQYLGYDYIEIPSNLLTNSVNPMHVYVNNRVLSPYNDNYGFGEEDLFSPMSYTNFLEAFCNLYGLIAHESVYNLQYKCLTFTRVDYTGNYLLMAVSSLNDTSVNGTIITPSSLTFSNIFSIADSNSVESRILPIGKLEINHGEYLDEAKMNLRLSTLLDDGTLYGMGKVMYMAPLSITNGGEFYSRLWNNSTALYTDYQRQGDMTRTAGDGEKEVIDLSFSHEVGTPSNDPLFEYTFSKFPRLHWGSMSFVMKTKEKPLEGTYRFQLQSGNQYLNMSGIIPYWSTTPAILDNIYYNDDGELRIDGIGATTNPITVRVYQAAYTRTYWGNPIVELKLTTKSSPLAVYKDPRVSPIKTIKVEGSKASDSIDMPIHDYIDNPGRIIGGSLLAQNQYSYMFSSLSMLKVNVKRLSNTDLNILALATFTINGTSGWKLLTISGNVWDNTFDLVFIKSN